MTSRDCGETPPRPEDSKHPCALADLTVRHLKPVIGKRITYLDRWLKGCGVMVMPTGHGFCVLSYGPDRRRIKLGDVGVLKLADTRDQARQTLARYQLGLENEARSPTIEDARREFWRRRSRTATKTARSGTRPGFLFRHLSSWNKKDLDELTAQDVRAEDQDTRLIEGCFDFSGELHCAGCAPLWCSASLR